MPIFVFRCINCKSPVEKIVLAKVKASTVPTQIVQPCQKCAALTRHLRAVTAPSYVGTTPPGTSQAVTRMSQIRPPKDKDWKTRVLRGLNPAGRPLTNLRELNRQDWEEQVETAFPNLQEKQQEVVGRAKTGELTNLITAATSEK
jgi:hypothetical protein